MDPGTIAAVCVVIAGAPLLAWLQRQLGWHGFVLLAIVLAFQGVVAIPKGEIGYGTICLTAAVLVAGRTLGIWPDQYPPSYLWRRRPGAHVVYILRNAEGIPLYIGRSKNFEGRIAQHRRRPEPWRKTVDSWNSMPARWVRGERAAIRIERRRIRCATVLTGWHYVPELNNDAEVTSGRVWFPRTWALVYAGESLLFRRARLLSPLRMPRPSEEGEEAVEVPVVHVQHESAETFDDRWPERVVIGAQVRSDEGASASDRPGSDAQPDPDPAGRAPADADADADVSPPSGEPLSGADASADGPRSDSDAILSVVNGDSGSAGGTAAPMDTQPVVVRVSADRGSKRTGPSKRAPKAGSDPKHDDATRERWRRNKAAARAQGRAR